MFKSKKAIENHIIVIFLISIIISSFLFFILDGIYGKSHKDCANISYEILDICKKVNSVDFTIKNDDIKPLKISFNDYINDRNLVEANSVEILNYVNNVETIDIVPFIRSGGKVYLCNGQKQTKNIKLISKKC